MIHELREYEFLPADWQAYEECYDRVGRAARGDDFGRLLGAWTAREAERVHFVHLWAYESLDARARLRAALAQVPAWSREFIPAVRHLAQRQTLTVLHPVAGGVSGASHVWLNRLACRAGHAPDVLQALRGDPDTVGLWSTEFPDPNGVVQLAAEATLESPPMVREARAMLLTRKE